MFDLLGIFISAQLSEIAFNYEMREIRESA